MTRRSDLLDRITEQSEIAALCNDAPRVRVLMRRARVVLGRVPSTAEIQATAEQRFQAWQRDNA